MRVRILGFVRSISVALGFVGSVLNFRQVQYDWCLKEPPGTLCQV